MDIPLDEIPESRAFHLSGEGLARLLGQHDENLKVIEARYPVSISVNNGVVRVSGPDLVPVKIVENLLHELISAAEKGHEILASDVRVAMDALSEMKDPSGPQGRDLNLNSLYSEVICTTSKGKPIRAKTPGQRAYIKAIRENNILFASGPAGTGKTYLAVCEAVSMLKTGKINRIILVRPAVEAGESLGFLPGDLQEKIEPYVRPLYDAFYELLSPEKFLRYTEKGIIEIAPLAYMRGRTLNESFIILDEAQNTTPKQMKMFLTRLGFGSKAVVTGDITQTDLPGGAVSGLKSVKNILAGIQGIGFFDLTGADIVRHELVQKIVQAYSKFENENNRKPDSRQEKI